MSISDEEKMFCYLEMGDGAFKNSYNNLTIIFMKGYLQKASLKNLLTLII
jgi:hypothetical protein